MTLDESFARSCTAKDDIRLKPRPQESEYEVTMNSQNGHPETKEYLANVWTNNGLGS